MIDKFAANESLYMLRNVTKQHTNSKKKKKKKKKQKQKQMTLYLLAIGHHKKTIKVMKVLLVHCAPYARISKAIAMARSNRYF